MNKRQKELLQHQFDSEKAVLEQLEKQYQAALNDINRKIRILQSDEMTQSKIYRLEYQKALKKQVEAILEKLHSDEFTTIQDYLSTSYTDAFIGTMYDIAGQGIPLVLPIDQEAAVTAILTDSKISEGLYTALGVDTTALKKAISAEVTRGIASGMSYADIARNISNVSKAPLSRAKTIARTEGHRIQQESTRDAQQGAKSKGADVVKQWDSTLDGKTRPSHRKVDGEIRELDEKFSNGLDFPGDPGGKAGEVVNCRCVSLTRARWALDEDELNTLKDRAKFFGLDKTKNFEDFRGKYLKAAKLAADESAKQGVGNVDIAGKSAILKLKNYAGLDGYLTKEYGVNVPSDVRNLDYASVQESMAGLDYILKEFPQAHDMFTGLACDNSGVMAADYYGGITFNPKHYIDYNAVVKQSSNRFNTATTAVFSNGSHEAGHLLEATLIRKNKGNTADWNNCTFAKQIVSEALKNAKKQPDGKGKLAAALIGEVSHYARQDRSECLAECISDYSINGEKAALLSREVWKILKRELG